LEEFNLDEALDADPDWLTSIDVTRETGLAGAGYLCCGEGSYGSEGFAARLDEHKNLAWVIYLEESNPFTDIVIAGMTATFSSSSGVSITVDIYRPGEKLSN